MDPGAVLRGWFLDLLKSLAVGLVLLLPVFISDHLRSETVERTETLELGWRLGDEGLQLPPQARALEEFLVEREEITHCTSREFEREDWAGSPERVLELVLSVEQKGLSSPSYSDLLSPKMAELGYPNWTSLGSVSVSKSGVRLEVGGWIQIAFLLSSAGFLFYGFRSWSSREIELSAAVGTPMGLGRVVLLVGALALVLFGVHFVLLPLLGVHPPYAGLSLAWYMGPSIMVPVAVLLLGLFVPGQELFLRHQLYARMRDAGRPALGGLLASGLPALILVINPFAAIVLFLQGLLSCWLYSRTGRILAPMLLAWIVAGSAIAMAANTKLLVQWH